MSAAIRQLAMEALMSKKRREILDELDDTTQNNPAEQMKAAILREMGMSRPYANSKPLLVEDVSLDPPGPGELLIKIKATGLCHSDLSVINGDRPRPMPMILGHEAAGEVQECGAFVTDLKPGDQVVLTFVPSCGSCIPCMEGRPALCEPGARANVAGTLLSGARRLRLQENAGLPSYWRLRVCGIRSRLPPFGHKG